MKYHIKLNIDPLEESEVSQLRNVSRNIPHPYHNIALTRGLMTAIIYKVIVVHTMSSTFRVSSNPSEPSLLLDRMSFNDVAGEEIIQR